MAITPILFATKDSATGQLTATATPSATSLLLQSGNGALFPQPYSGTASSLGTNVTLNCTGISAVIGGSAAVGKAIYNATDNSVAFITAVATNSVTTTRLLGGTLNIWSNSDEWRIDSFAVTLVKISTSSYGVQSDGQIEEVLIKGRSTDTLTVATSGRGYNGTTAAQFDSGDFVQLRVTSPIMERLKDVISALGQQLNTDRTDILALLAGSSLDATTTGSANNYAATLSSMVSTPAQGMKVRLKANFTNTGASNYNHNSSGNVAIKKMYSTGLSDLASGDIQSGQMFDLEFDGTYWQLTSTPANVTTPATGVNYRYGTGADGALSVPSGTTTLDFGGASILIKNYTSINIAAGATLAVSNVAAAGGLLILLSQGNVTIDGTIDLSGKGSTGGAGVSRSVTSATASLLAGNPATAPYNSGGQTRIGSGGAVSINGGVAANASGGCGGSSASAAASSTSAAGVAGADSAGVALTAAIAGMVGPSGILAGPGAGGDSGGACVNVAATYTSGTFSATSGAGGNGGGGLCIECGGNFSFTGTINLSGTNAGSASTANGSGTNYAVAAGGSGGGAAGTGKADVAGSIINSGTVTANGGTGTAGSTASTGGISVAKSDGTNGANGAFTVCKSY